MTYIYIVHMSFDKFHRDSFERIIRHKSMSGRTFWLPSDVHFKVKWPVLLFYFITLFDGEWTITL